ncbi:hypothetical protein CR513_60817, partial [Mucuna pruriens]
MGSNRNDWCEFHRAHSHSIEECRTLQVQIKNLIREGHLGQYVMRRGKEGRGEGRAEQPTMRKEG